jgi:hypothetical protein
VLSVPACDRGLRAVLEEGLLLVEAMSDMGVGVSWRIVQLPLRPEAPAFRRGASPPGLCNPCKSSWPGFVPASCFFAGVLPQMERAGLVPAP